MKIEQWFAEELRRWSRQPTVLTPADAARSVTAHLRPRAIARSRPALRPVLVASAAGLAAVVTVAVLLRERPRLPRTSGTPATITLASGTLVVIDLGEVRR